VEVAYAHQPLHFKFPIIFEDVTITKTIYSSKNPADLEIYISVDPRNQTPGPDSNQFHLINDSVLHIPAYEFTRCE
jgi:hypothetical protein